MLKANVIYNIKLGINHKKYIHPPCYWHIWCCPLRIWAETVYNPILPLNAILDSFILLDILRSICCFAMLCYLPHSTQRCDISITKSNCKTSCVWLRKYPLFITLESEFMKSSDNHVLAGNINWTLYNR